MSTSDRRRRGLLLDLDGTLANSLPVLRSVYRDFLAEFGILDQEDEFQHLNGPPLAEVVETLRRTHRLPGDPADLHARYQQLLGDAHTKAPMADGARTVLECARAHGWTVAVVTSAGHTATRDWLRRHRLNDLVTAVVGGDDVSCWKPDPEAYRTATHRTSCAAEDSLAVEDSEPGALAALGAGIPTMFIGAGTPDSVAVSPLFRGLLADLASVVDCLEQ